LYQVTLRSGTEWVWGRWPLGGYVQMLNTRIKPVAKTQWRMCFDQQPIWKRCVILAAGGVANVVFAWVALTVYYCLGHPEHVAFIKAVAPASIAAKAGLAAGDQLESFGDIPTHSWQEAGIRLVASLGQAKVVLTAKTAQGEVKPLDLDLSQQLVFKRSTSLWSSLGIVPDVSKEHVVSGTSFATSMVSAALTVGELLGFFLTMIKQLILGRLPLFLLLGPIGLFKVASLSFVQGISMFSYFIASLSIAVGLINLFPIPGLDGGSIVYALVEKFQGKPVSIALEVLLYQLAMIAFFVLLMQLLGNDLQRMMNG
jgi:regulator of sigma E protease